MTSRSRVLSPLIFVCLTLLYLLRLSLNPPLLPSGLPAQAGTDLEAPLKLEFTLLDYPTAHGRKLSYPISHLTVIWPEYTKLNLGAHYQIVATPEISQTLGYTTRVQLLVNETKILDPNPKLNLGQKLTIAISKLRLFLTQKLARALPEPESSLAAGILLGVKRDISYDFRQALISSGTLHTIAASGYNVSLVTRFILALTVALPLTLSLSLAGLGIILFCILAGGSAAVIRAGVMGALILLGTGLGRQKQGLHLLFVAGYSMLLFDPLYLFDVGWQLSVSATFGILYLEPPLSRWLAAHISSKSILVFLQNYLSPTLAATITTLPISYFTFQKYSLISPLANLLVLPTIPLIMGLTTILLLVSAFAPVLTSIFALPLYLPLTYFVWVVNILGRL